MDLKAWLGTILEGKKLSAALDKCAEAFVENLQDLVDLHDAGKTELETVFPKMLAMKIHAALTELKENGGITNMMEGTTERKPGAQLSEARIAIHAKHEYRTVSGVCL